MRTKKESARMRVQFNGECPGIGTGWRIVEVQVGRKWVRLATEVRRAKITKGLWEQMATSAQALPPRKKTRKPRVKKTKAFGLGATVSPETQQALDALTDLEKRSMASALNIFVD
jgi:hypothetical protein